MKRKTWLVCICCLFFMCEAFAQEKNNFSVKRGINISHWLSQSNSRGEKRSAFFTESDVKFLSESGFDHLRLPVDEEQLFTVDGKKEKEAFSLLHNALLWCQKYRLKAIVDLHILRSHHFNAKEKPLFTDQKEQNRFYDLWKQISRELSSYSVDFLAYELMNEPVADDHEQWNNIVAECIRTIRSLEPERSLLVGSNRWQGYETVQYLKLPKNDPNLIISFHYYNPFLLTHYRASWTDVKDYTGKVHYPGKLIADEDLKQLEGKLYDKFAYWNKVEFNKDVIEKHLQEVVDFARLYKLPVYCGEFGCISATPKADKIRWYQDMISLFDKYGIARANWDYKGGFGIVENGKPQAILIDILTGKNIK